MAIGPGKYDELATYVREQAEAKAVAVIVVDGNKGHGFAQQFAAVGPEHAADALMMFADTLRAVANQMQADARRLRATKRGN